MFVTYRNLQFHKSSYQSFTAEETFTFSYSSNKIKIQFQNKMSVLCISIYKHASHPIRKLYEVSLASPPSHVTVGRQCRYEKGHMKGVNYSSTHS